MIFQAAGLILKLALILAVSNQCLGQSCPIVPSYYTANSKVVDGVRLSTITNIDQQTCSSLCSSVPQCMLSQFTDAGWNYDHGDYTDVYHNKAKAQTIPTSKMSTTKKTTTKMMTTKKMTTTKTNNWQTDYFTTTNIPYNNEVKSKCELFSSISRIVSNFDSPMVYTQFSGQYVANAFETLKCNVTENTFYWGITDWKNVINVSNANLCAIACALDDSCALWAFFNPPICNNSDTNMNWYPPYTAPSCLISTSLWYNIDTKFNSLIGMFTGACSQKLSSS